MNEEMSFEDARIVLKTGGIDDLPEPDIKKGESKYRVVLNQNLC